MKAFRSAKFFELSSGVAKFNSTLKFFKSIVHPIFKGIIAIDLPFPDDVRYTNNEIKQIIFTKKSIDLTYRVK